MKLYTTLILAALAIAFMGGYLGLNATRVQTARVLEESELLVLVGRFQETTKPVGTLDLNRMYPEAPLWPLADPFAAFPHTFYYPLEHLRELVSYATSCRSLSTKPDSSIAGLKKGWQWHRYRCHKETPPQLFYETPPYLHPSGVSYAQLAYRERLPPFDAPRALKDAASYFHFLELAKIADIEALPELFRGLSGLSDSDALLIHQRSPIVLSDSGVFFQSEGEGSHYQLASYLKYSRKEWSDFWFTKGILAENRLGNRSCNNPAMGLCWKLDPQYSSRWMNRLSRWSFFSSVCLVGLIVLTVFVKLRDDKWSHLKQQFALQTLTHELSTPITAMRLSVEEFRGGISELSEDIQVAFLRVCDNLQRLQRLTDVSRQYLKVSKERKLIALSSKTIASCKDFIEAAVAPYDPEKVRVADTGGEGSVQADPYWLSLCLKNLIENGLKHGKAPVSLRVVRTAGKVQVEIQDEGASELSFKEMLSPFKKSTKSGGLGLGMSIVNSIIQEMGGKLSYRSHPTTFTIELKA